MPYTCNVLYISIFVVLLCALSIRYPITSSVGQYISDRSLLKWSSNLWNISVITVR